MSFVQQASAHGVLRRTLGVEHIGEICSRVGLVDSFILCPLSIRFDSTGYRCVNLIEDIILRFTIISHS